MEAKFEIHVENQVEQEHCLEKSLVNTHINFKMTESSDASCRIQCPFLAD